MSTLSYPQLTAGGGFVLRIKKVYYITTRLYLLSFYIKLTNLGGRANLA